MSKFAWVTLTTNDTYSLGALVLAHSLKRAGTAHQLAVLVTPGVSEAMRSKLKDVYNVVQEVNVLDSQDAANLALLARPELGITFTKLHCWRLVQFEKCVFLDSDTLVLQNCDELFEREELSAAPDVSWPDCFNSGVFVYKPSVETYGKITQFALENGSFDGGDQGLLNSYFSDWAHTDIKKHLPFVYNVTAYASYCYLPAFKQFRDKIKILHFAGKLKPWLIQFNSENRTACTPTDYAHATDLIQLWWNIFCDQVHEKLNDQMNYWLGLMPPNNANQIYSFEQNYHDQNNDNNINYHEQYMQQQDHFLQQEQQQHQQKLHEQQQQQYHFDFENVKDFEDPWVDYYENLEATDLNENIASNAGEEMRKEYHEENMKILERCNEESRIEIVGNVQNIENEFERCSQTPPTPTAVSENIAPPTPEAANAMENLTSDVRNLDAKNCSTDIDKSREDSVQTTETHTTETFDTSSPSPSPSSSSESASHFQSPHKESCTDESHSNNNEAGLAGALSQLRLGEQRTPEQDAYEQLMRRQCWESGQIDYAGKDSFDNIWKKISQTLDTKPTTTSTEDDKSADNSWGFPTDNHSQNNNFMQEPTVVMVQRQDTEVEKEFQNGGSLSLTAINEMLDHPPVQKTIEVVEEEVAITSIDKDIRNERLLTSADIEDGKVEYDPATNAKIEYKVIEGGYEVHTTTPQPNGTIKTSVRTFFDPKPCSEEDLKQEAITKKQLKSRLNKEVRIDKNTTMLTRAIEGGYEEVYTTINEDGSRSSRTKTFFHSVPADVGFDHLGNNNNDNNQQVAEKPKSKKQLTRKSSVETSDSTESRTTKSKKNVKQESTYEESRRVTENVEYTEDNQTVRKNSVQEQSVKAISQTSNTSDSNQSKNKKKKGKSNIPPPPPEFIENDTTTVTSKRVPGGVEYTYSTTLESGKTITTTKTVYEEESTELTEEEIRVYKKTLKDAEKHKNVAAPKKLKSESGTKKVVPSENPGDVTTVETIKIDGGTEYHYTTVTAEGIVKKATKTVYDAVPCKANPDDTDEEEIIEEYEEEIIEPGEKNFRTIETIKQLPTKFEEEVTITSETHEKKEKKVKKSMVISH